MVAGACNVPDSFIAWSNRGFACDTTDDATAVSKSGDYYFSAFHKIEKQLLENILGIQAVKNHGK